MRLSVAAAALLAAHAISCAGGEEETKTTASSSSIEQQHHQQRHQRQDVLSTEASFVRSSHNRRSGNNELDFTGRQQKEQQQQQQEECIPTNGSILTNSGLKDLNNQDDRTTTSGSSSSSSLAAERQEIDDTARSSGSNDFVGILSCGFGQYCRESSESSLGGFCADLDADTEDGSDDTTAAAISSASSRRASSSRASSRFPQEQQLVRGHRSLHAQRQRQDQVVGRLTVLQLADLFCNRPDESGLVLDCDCNDMDFENNTGTLSCYVGPGCTELDTGCDSGSGGLSAESGGALDFARTVEQFDHCTTEVFTANITTESLYEYTSCYTQTMPQSNYTFSYCTDFAFNAIDGPTCDIEIDGVKCNSCDIAIGAGVTYGENCEVFDCTNTFLNYAGDRCGAFTEPTLRYVSITEYLYDAFWPCPSGGCNLCGDGGRMTTGFENFTYTTQFLNVTDTFYCYDVNYQALTGGLYGTSYCSTLPGVVQDVCGCSNPSQPSTPTDDSSNNQPQPQPGPPSEAPTDDSELSPSTAARTGFQLSMSGDGGWGTRLAISSIGSFVLWSVLSINI
mmetsp:Transcript_19531/g.47152  ORF Transcript_19531/g.47152 Transcript_19531/m.47152 type:complete len:565 (+) Transcript_19531:132-1826(+)